MKKIIIFLFIFSILIGMTSQAAHVAGGEITFNCVGQDSFIVTVITYRDCNGTSPSGGITLEVHCKSPLKGLKSINLGQVSPIDITPVCKTNCTRCNSPSCSFAYGVQKHVRVSDIIDLSSAGSCCEILFSYNTWFRSQKITTGLSTQHGYIEATMNRCLDPCNSSPVFNSTPQTLFALSSEVFMDFGVESENADSIVYELIAPRKSRNVPNTFGSYYSYDKPVFFWGFPDVSLPYPKGLHLDRYSGILKFRWHKSETTVIVVRAREYLQGQVKSEIMRDILVSCDVYNVRGVPSIQCPPKTSVVYGDTISIEAAYNHWYFGKKCRYRSQN